METPKVSVIIPVYNTEKYLRQCLDSVLGQTLRDIEVICVDDGSTDGSLAILREYEERDGRVKVLTQENLSAGAARNHGLAHATGEYLSFLDADDFFEADMLEKAYRQAVETDAQIVVFRCDFYYEDIDAFKPAKWTVKDELLPRHMPFAGADVKRNLFGAFVGWPWDKLFLASFVKENHLTFQEQRTTNDLLFVYASLAKAERISVMRDVFAHQRRNGNASLSVTRERSWKCFYHALTALKEQLKQWDLFSRFEQDLVNYSLNFSLWNLKTLSWPTQEELYDLLKTQWYDELGVSRHEEKYFYNAEEYAMYRSIMEKPYEAVFPGRKRTPMDACEHPKVSVIMPSLNVRPYIRECVESVLDQTLKEIEVICVDAGSTDGTLEILEEYAKWDKRVQIIHSEKKSYGYQMNLGMDAARGEYIGIVETDDFVEANMLEDLYTKAAEQRLDMIKSNFLVYKDGEKETYVDLIQADTKIGGAIYGQVIRLEQEPRLLLLRPATWTGLYRRDFLTGSQIRYLETPGASYQDTSFSLKVLLGADRLMLVPEAYYHYRRDNFTSSVHAKDKVFAVCEEYKAVEQSPLLRGEKADAALPVLLARKFRTYIWNYERLGPDNGYPFLKQFRKEVLAAAACAWPQYLSLAELEKIKAWIPDAQSAFHTAGEVSLPCRAPHDPPKVSVIIPVYNVEPYIAQCLDSIVGQTLGDIEIICVNDGSADGSWDILERYQKADARVTLVSQFNGGQSKARNTGLRYAHGKYVYFIDGDDFIDPDALAFLYQEMERDELDILFFDAASFYETEEAEEKYPSYKTTYTYQRGKALDGVYTGQELLAKFRNIGGYRVSPCLQMTRRDHIAGRELRFYEGIIYEDNLFTFQNLLTAARTSHRNIPFYHRRVRDGSVMTLPKTDKNFFGYFTCYEQMAASLLLAEIEPMYEKELLAEIEIVRKSAASEYRFLMDHGSCVDVSHLNQVERAFFNALFLPASGRAKADPSLDGFYKAELAAVRASWSYRIGRAVTFLPRKLRGGIRCYREHGARYTWKRLLAHLGL